MKKNVIHYFMIFLSLTVLPWFPAVAADPIAKVAALRGRVTALNNGDTRVLSPAGPIFEQDTLKTGEHSRIQIIFTDNTIITLGGSTQLEISRYAWNEAEKTGVMTHEIKEGVFRVLGGAITGHAPEKFTTRTPVATIGIRGSIYKGRMRNNSLSVLFEGGTGIDVTNEAGSIPVLKPGYGTIVSGFNTLPSMAARFTARQIEAIDKEFAPQGGPNPPKTGYGNTSQRQATQATACGVKFRPSPVPTDIIIDLPDPEPLDILGVSGSYTSLLEDGTGSVSIYRYGQSSGLNQNGVVSGTVDLDNGQTRPFSYVIPDFGENTGYDGIHFHETNRELNILDEFIDIPSIVMSSSLGEFSIFSIPFEPVTPLGPSFKFADLGFAGIPALNVPGDGIDSYSGLMMAVGTLVHQDFGRSLEYGNFTCEINWHTNTYIAHLSHLDDNFGKGPVIFGHLNGTQFGDLFMAGPGLTRDNAPESDPGFIDWLDANLNTGEFYGQIGQGFGLTGDITVKDVHDQTQVFDTMDFICAGMLEVDPMDDEPVSPTGMAYFRGFVAGLSENMADPKKDRSLFLNRSPDDVTIILNRDTGSVTGQINAQDIFGNTGDLHLTIGPDSQSAYVLDDHFVAYLGNGQGGPGDITTLKPHGSYLVTAPPADDKDIINNTYDSDRQFSEHLQWGYWEAAYKDPVTDMDHHIHVPGAFWIAGQTTPDEVIHDLIHTDFTGTYEGMAQGISIDNGWVSPLENGHTLLDIDFSPSAVHPVSGLISFDSVTLTVLGTTPVTAAGFSAGIEGAPSGVNGAFFGPDADAVGGTSTV